MKRAILLAGLLASAAAAAWQLSGATTGSPNAVADALPAAGPITGSAAVSNRIETGIAPAAGTEARKAYGCTVRLRDYVAPDGRAFEAHTCPPDREPFPHPYEHYDDATLKLMSYSDADAAATLGRRVVGASNEHAYRLLVRATALDGDVSHLHWLADQAFSAVRIDGKVQVDNLKRRYELAALAAHLGGNPANPVYWQQELHRAGVAKPQLEELDNRVEKLLRKVRTIQVDVFGEVRFGGLSDA